MGVGDNTACHCSGNLTSQNICPIGRGYHNCATFILLAGLWQPSLMEVAVVMSDQFYGTVNGNPVGMNIPQTHKDANHDAFVMEIFGFFYFLYHNHFPVAGGNDNTLCVAFITSDGALEEIDKNQVYADANSCKQVEWYLIGKKEVKDGTDGQKKNGADHQGGSAFVV